MPPLLELVQSKKVTATVTLEQSTAELVDRYAQYVNGGADEVVDKALNYVFSKDKDFQKYAEENKGEAKAPSASPVQAHRVCAQRDGQGESPVMVRPRKQLIDIPNRSSKDKNGASHPKNMTLHPRWGHAGYTSVHLCRINELQFSGVPRYTAKVRRNHERRTRTRPRKLLGTRTLPRGWHHDKAHSKGS